MLVSHSVPAMTGGISQQPASLRFPDQAEDIKNGWPSLTKGLQKRPPSEQYGELLGPSWDVATDDPAFHFVDRDSSERYLVSVCHNDGDDERLRVHDLFNVSGGNISKLNVQFTRSAYNYLDATDSAAYRFQTIGDVTYVVNREKTPAMDPYQEPARPPQAMLFVRNTLSTAADEDVVVTFNGTSTAPIHDPDASTVVLAYNIYAALTGADSLEGTWSFGHHSNRFLKTGHGLTVGQAIRFSNPSSGWFRWPYYTVTYNAAGNPVIRKYYGYGSENKTFYVVAAGANWIKVSTSPGGQAINLSDYNSSSTYTVYSLGTGSPPSGFSNLNVQTLPYVAGASEDSIGNILILSTKDGEDFDITVRDGAGDSLVSLYKDTTPSFTELPDTCMHGFRLRVVNDPGTGLDDYLVEFVGDNGPGEISKGYWKEIASPDEPIRIDPSSMPHILVRKADGSFVFREAGPTKFQIESIEAGNPNELVISTGCANHPLGLTGSNAVLLSSGDLVYIRNSERVQVPDGQGGNTLVAEDKEYYVEVISTDSSTQTIKLYSQSSLSGGSVVDVSDAGSGVYGELYKEDDLGYEWSPRLSGDALTNPEPSFIGKPIRDVAYYKNRLVFLAGENVICSEAGAFFSFWRTTVATLIDSDPIDIASAVAQIATLQSAVPYGNLLWITGDRIQLALGPAQGQPLSPRTADLKVVSNFEVNNARKPILMETALYAPFTRGEYIGLYDFHYDPQIEGRFEGNDATEHVPHLIAGGIRAMAALEREGVLAVVPTQANTMWVYKTFKYNGSPVQQAWAHYTFYNADIRSAFFYDNQLYMVVGRVTHGSTTWWIDKIDFKPDAVDPGLDYLNYIDRKYQYTSDAGEVSVDGATTVLGSVGTLPDMPTGAPMEVIGTNGVRHTVISSTADTITIRGAHGGKTFWIGERYAMEYDFGTIYVRERRTPTGQANIAITSGRTHLRRGRIKYGDTSYFRVEVTDRNGKMFSYPFTGRQLGDSLLSIGSRPSATGTFDFPINGKNDEMTIKIINDSPFESNLTGADFDSNFVLRGRRI